MANRELVYQDLVDPLIFFGEHDQHLRLIEKEFLVSIYPKGHSLRIEGQDKDISLAEKTLNFLFQECQRGKYLKKHDLEVVVHQVKEDEHFEVDGLDKHKIILHKNGKQIKPKTTHQANYLESIKEHDLIFGIGPAGTGKTYLAVAMGISYLLQDKVQRLILTRPVVEAGENLGFLPGDLQQKINPYLRPIFDAIYDMMPYEDFIKYRERERIEIAPLAYMRGRTLNNAFTILDEAQNTTMSQLKMFLTRLGPTSKTIITGDITQIDLPKKHTSGLLAATHILKQIKEIKFNYFDDKDIVRHPIVRKIVKAFDKYENELKIQ